MQVLWQRMTRRHTDGDGHAVDAQIAQAQDAAAETGAIVVIGSVTIDLRCSRVLCELPSCKAKEARSHATVHGPAVCDDDGIHLRVQQRLACQRHVEACDMGR